jgi:hypothetical protein
LGPVGATGLGVGTGVDVIGGGAGPSLAADLMAGITGGGKVGGGGTVPLALSPGPAVAPGPASLGLPPGAGTGGLGQITPEMVAPEFLGPPSPLAMLEESTIAADKAKRGAAAGQLARGGLGVAQSALAPEPAGTTIVSPAQPRRPVQQRPQGSDEERLRRLLMLGLLGSGRPPARAGSIRY